VKARPLREVVVTGMGVIGPHGFDAEEMFQRLRRGESGIRRITHFDTSWCPCKIGGVVEGFDARQFFKDREALRIVRLMDKVHQWALAASHLALVDAGLEEALLSAPRDRRGSDTGIYLGAGLSGRSLMEKIPVTMLQRYREAVRDGRVPAMDVASWLSRAEGELIREIGDIVGQDVNPMDFLQQCPSVAAAYIAMRYRAMGPNVTMVSLCAAGAQAIGEAAWAVARGDADIALAGGADSMLNPLDLTAFCKLDAVTARSHEVEAASKPFDLRRDGCVVGEGAAVLVLEPADRVMARGARAYAEVAGYGTSDDGYKISAPPEDGHGAVLAMTRALDSAGLRPEDVDHINAHGTSTPLNDRIETAAIKRVFGAHARAIPIVSTKSMTGHLIAAAGALEAVIAVKSLQHRMVPPTINLEKADPLCDLDYVPEGARALARMETVLSNSFAIGGVNAALLFRRAGSS
jgi:3-oxoacyl-[acyl-carrier-protein] synthase II